VRRAPGAPMPAPPPLVVDGQRVPAPLLDGAVAAIERDLAALRIGPGSLVLAPAENGVTLVAAAVAAWRQGVPLVMAPPPHGGDLPFAVAARVADAGGGPRVIPVAGGGEPPLVPEGAGVVFWTSGSTGRPRAVIVSREGVAYQVEATIERMAYEPDDALLVPLSLAHAYGFSLLAVCATLGAGLSVQSCFGMPALARRLLDGQVTSLDGVPSLYRLLLARARAVPELRAALAALRIHGCGGDLLPASLAAEWAAVVGRPLLDGYGLSEAGPNVALNGPGDVRQGTVGRPLAGTEVRRDPVSGELLVRSPSVFAGYVDDGREAGEDPRTADGWLRTGDTGAIDAGGYVTIGGRLKDALIVHGETIPPALIEEALAATPGVTGCCVVGVRGGGARGDDVFAFVESGADVRAALRGRARAALAPHLRPRHVALVAELPRLAGGKLDRVELRRRARLLASETTS